MTSNATARADGIGAPGRGARTGGGRKSRPSTIDPLLVAEAPPAALGRYFYFENVRAPVSSLDLASSFTRSALPSTTTSSLAAGRQRHARVGLEVDRLLLRTGAEVQRRTVEIQNSWASRSVRSVSYNEVGLRPSIAEARVELGVTFSIASSSCLLEAAASTRSRLLSR